jgi:predicted Zn-dependent protease
MANDTTKPVLKELEISILETSTNFTKQQLNELEWKLKQSDMLIAYDVERLQKEFIEFKKCVKNFKRHLVEAILLMTASIVFIYALFFFYK